MIAWILSVVLLGDISQGGAPIAAQVAPKAPAVTTQEDSPEDDEMTDDEMGYTDEDFEDEPEEEEAPDTEESSS